MKKLLNTVYVTTPGAALRKDGENLVAEIDGAVRARAPLHMLGGVVTFGAISVTPALTGACAAAGITLTLLDRAGRFQARVEGPTTGNVRKRRLSPTFSPVVCSATAPLSQDRECVSQCLLRLRFSDRSGWRFMHPDIGAGRMR